MRRYLRTEDIMRCFALTCDKCGADSEVSYMMGEEGRRAVSCRHCGQLYQTFLDDEGKPDLVIYNPPPRANRLLN